MKRDDTAQQAKALESRMHVLVREHADAAARVEAYGRRRHLTPGEELELKMYRRLKLMKKDQIAALERELAAAAPFRAAG